MISLSRSVVWSACPQDEKEALLQYRSTVASLVGRAKTIVQLKPRSSDHPVRSSIPVKAICDYRQIEVISPALPPRSPALHPRSPALPPCGPISCLTICNTQKWERSLICSSLLDITS